MRNGKSTLLLLTGLALVFGAHAGEPAGTADDSSGMSGRIKAIDPLTGKSRLPTAAEIAALRTRAASMKTPALSTKLPKTYAEASRMVTVLEDGSERLPASEDSLSTVMQTRQADGTYATSHGSADGHADAAKAKEADSE